jgi:hypothetical protein
MTDTTRLPKAQLDYLHQRMLCGTYSHDELEALYPSGEDSYGEFFVEKARLTENVSARPEYFDRLYQFKTC